jgi:hypothetical protein
VDAAGPRLTPSGTCLLTGQGERAVVDHVLLAADELALAALEQQVADVDAVPLRGDLGVAQERRVHAGVAQRAGLAVHAHGPVLQWPDDVVGGVLELEQVATVLEVHEVGDGDERLDGAVPRTGAVTGQGRVDAVDPVLDRDDRVRAPDRIEVHAVGDGSLNDFVREHNDGEGVDAVISTTLGPGSPKETLLEALSTLARGGTLVDIGGMMEHPELDLFHLMCNQQSAVGSLWFTNGEAQEMSDLAGSGALDLSVLEHHVFPLEKINEALDDGLPARHGGFSNFIITPDQALLSGPGGA